MFLKLFKVQSSIGSLRYIFINIDNMYVSESCDGVPGFSDPRVEDDSTFNPMQEFIHPSDSSYIFRDHTHFMEKHNIVYGTQQEHLHRRQVFIQNYRFIQSKNRAHLGFKLSINHLADKTEDELKNLRGLRRSGKYNGGLPFPYKLDKKTVVDLPNNFDWRIYGAVTPVKDQSTVCGSCWAFSAAGSIEGALFLHNNGELIHLSEQALIDCSWGENNFGCNGGENYQAYEWILNNGGIPTDASYGEYKAQDSVCRAHDKNIAHVAEINGWVNVSRGNSNALKVALLKNGPNSVSIDASPRSFSFYTNGIYYEPKWYSYT